MKSFICAGLALGLAGIWGTASAHVAPSAGARAAHGGVTVLIGNTMLSASLTPRQAVARVQQHTSFRLRLPAHVPSGAALRDVIGITLGKRHTVAIVELDYGGRVTGAFSLLESKMHVGASSAGGRRSTVRIGRVAGELIEWKKGHLHRFDLSWYSGIGYDLRTVDSRTALTRGDLLAAARSL